MPDYGDYFDSGLYAEISRKLKAIHDVRVREWLRFRVLRAPCRIRFTFLERKDMRRHEEMWAAKYGLA